ncbi:NAD(P)/FAD-dependent oxidoreductase [Corynebacterium variabile]|uniref:D-amino-acid oxidase n=1 Tax=Corynebacterium variabile TaxID=1727 RepID=A0A4Y4C0T4_9CORY|nr:FAD-dependent oxidoreductase [Corynebacterium variabile]GEC86661.1 D-amino-acid oxidase [Corynebacterium variabile]
MAERTARTARTADGMTRTDVCVIGAGVLGLTAARELASRGHTVTLLDAEAPFAGASHRSFAWINANNKPPHAYHRLNALGMEEHDRLQDELGGQWFHRSGSVLASSAGTPEQRAEFISERLDRLYAEHYPVEPVTRDDLAGLEPVVDWAHLLPDGGEALFFPDEGYLDADLFAAGLLNDLASRGVTVQQGRVTHLASDAVSAHVLLDNGVELTPDAVVVAAGAGSRALGLPVADLAAQEGATARTHSFLGLSVPTDVPLGRVVITDVINVRPRHDGRLWIQLPGVEHRVAEAVDATSTDAVCDEVRHLMEIELEKILGTPVPVPTVYLSGRSVPEDGFPLVGFTDEPRRIYALVAHSGMTLSALLGRLVAEELDGGSGAGEAGEAAELLASFRPDRPAASEPAPSTPFIGWQ